MPIVIKYTTGEVNSVYSTHTNRTIIRGFVEIGGVNRIDSTIVCVVQDYSRATRISQLFLEDVDAYGTFNREITPPTKFGLTNLGDYDEILVNYKKENNEKTNH